VYCISGWNMLGCEDDPVIEECEENSNEHRRRPTSFAGMLSAHVICSNSFWNEVTCVGIQTEEEVRFSKLII
jgi:hypothetical protein